MAGIRWPNPDVDELALTETFETLYMNYEADKGGNNGPELRKHKRSDQGRDFGMGQGDTWVW